jgi:hypothetical protein
MTLTEKRIRKPQTVEQKKKKAEYDKVYRAGYRERNKENIIQYRKEHQEEIHEYSARWYFEHKEDVLARNKQWNKEHQEEVRACHAQYVKEHPEQTRGYYNKWRKANPTKVRTIKAKHRTLGFVPLNQLFDGCEGHHIDKDAVIYIPKALHRSVYHNLWTGRGMEQINVLALQYLMEVRA